MNICDMSTSFSFTSGVLKEAWRICHKVSFFTSSPNFGEERQHRPMPPKTMKTNELTGDVRKTKSTEFIDRSDWCQHTSRIDLFSPEKIFVKHSTVDEYVLKISFVHYNLFVWTKLFFFLHWTSALTDMILFPRVSHPTIFTLNDRLFFF